MNRTRILLSLFLTVLSISKPVFGDSNINGTLSAEENNLKHHCSMLANQYRVALVAAGKELQELRDICSQSLEILQSKDFRSNLLSLQNKEDKIISAASTLDTKFLTFNQLADITALKNNRLHKFQSHYVLLGTYFDVGKIYSGSCKSGNEIRECKTYQFEDNRNNKFVATRVVTLGADSILESVVGRKIHGRWRSNNIFHRSCAINTFSHELMHAFSSKPTSEYYEPYFVDTLELDTPVETEGYPIATYLVGSIAQCTWLQKNEHIQSDTSALKNCVVKIGTDRFNSNDCE